MKDLHSSIKKKKKLRHMPTKCSYYSRSWGEKKDELDIFLFLMSSNFNEGDRCINICVLYNMINIMRNTNQ